MILYKSFDKIITIFQFRISIAYFEILEWIKSSTIFAYVLVSRINPKHLKELKQMQNLTSSLELRPRDYYLFWSMVLFLRLWYFNNQEKMEDSVKKFFALKDKNWYWNRIKELPERCLQPVQHEGPYWESLAAFILTWRMKYNSNKYCLIKEYLFNVQY